VRKWLTICQCIDAGKPPPPTRPYWDTRADLERRRGRREARREKLKALARMNPRRLVTRREAADLVVLSLRRVEFFITARLLRPVRVGHRALIRIGDLRVVVCNRAAACRRVPAA
jgi:hypothetical protein